MWKTKSDLADRKMRQTCEHYEEINFRISWIIEIFAANVKSLNNYKKFT